MKKYGLPLSLFLICSLLANCMSQISERSPEPPISSLPVTETDTPTSTFTFTPTPTLSKTPFDDVTKANADCFSGPSKAYKKVTVVSGLEIVNVLGKNNANGDWLVVRWQDFDCWIESNLLQHFAEYNEQLEIVSTPPPPTLIPHTPTPKRPPPDNSNALPTTPVVNPITPVVNPTATPLRCLPPKCNPPSPTGAP